MSNTRIDKRLNVYWYRIKYIKHRKPVLWTYNHEELSFEKPLCLTSMVCNQSFFDFPFVQYWADKVHDNFCDLMKASNQLSDDVLNSKVIYHRKMWEFIYICQALYENQMLQEGKKGLVFGVGVECLPDLFASYGCYILATDLKSEKAEEIGWLDTCENAGGNLKMLNKYGFCTSEEFNKRVQYRDVDMNCIPEDIKNYDFCWSACALEHIGGLQKGLDFVKNSLNTLRPGGIAIHTTEFNLSSNNDTLDTENFSIYRKKDIMNLVHELELDGNYVYPVDFHIGENIVDNFIDLPPYSKKDMHLRLLLEGYPSTSIGLIIRKGKK